MIHEYLKSYKPQEGKKNSVLFSAKYNIYFMVGILQPLDKKINTHIP